MAPALAVILYQKTQLAPASDLLVLARPAQLAANLADAERYVQILIRFSKSAFYFGQWPIPLRRF